MKRHAKAPSAGSTTRQAGRLRRFVRGVFATGGASSRADGTGAPSSARRRLTFLVAGVLATALILGATAASATAPTVTIEPAAPEYTTAHVEGEVNPEGTPTNYVFQYITDEAFQAHADEHQSVTVSATAGTFTLSFEGQSTTALPFNATAAEVEAGLNALSTIGGAGGTATVSGGPGDESGSSPYAVAFAAALAEANLPQLESDSSALSGGNASASVETTAEGRHPGFEGAQNGPSGTVETSAESVSGTLTGLTLNTTYHLRLHAENGEVADAIAPTFKTLAGPITPPVLSAPTVGAVTSTTAHFSAEVTAGAADPAFNSDCHFKYATAADFSDARQVACTPNPVTGAAATPVSADATELEPNKAYYVKLVASNAGGSEEAVTVASPSFTTATEAPGVITGTNTPDPLVAGKITVRGYVNAHRSEVTDCHFDFGPTESYGTTLPCLPPKPGLTVVQTLTIGATAGQFKLGFGGQSTTATGSGDTTAISPASAVEIAGKQTLISEKEAELGSSSEPEALEAEIHTLEKEVADLEAPAKTITGLSVSSGTFDVGKEITGAGIPANTTITAVPSATSLSISKPATADATGVALVADIPFDASAGTVARALGSLSSIGVGNVSVSGGPGNVAGSNPYSIAFLGKFAGHDDVEPISVSDGAIPLSGGSGSSISSEHQIGNQPVEVTIDPENLTPGATYHFQVTATNAAGTTTSAPDATFTVAEEESSSPCSNQVRREEQHSAFLPDCRAYEMVSPPDKNGGDVLPDSQRVRAATDGGAVAFASMTGFGDAASNPLSLDYMAERSTDPTPGSNGWSTHAITPPQESVSAQGVVLANPGYVGDFSPDLSTGIFKAWSPLTEDAATHNALNLYERTDLRHAGTGSYNLMTSCPACAEGQLQTLMIRAEGGTFALTFEGQETGPLAYNASFAEVQSELNALGSIGGAGASVTVRGGPGNPSGSTPYVIGPFGGSLAASSVPVISVTPSSLTGSSPAATVEPALPPLVFRPEAQAPYFDGASADFSHVIFRSRLKLTSNAPGSSCTGLPINSASACPFKLYESEHGTVRLVGLVPPEGEIACGEPPLPACSPAPRSVAGQDSGHNNPAEEVHVPHVISTDGRRIFFTVGNTPPSQIGNLYMRVDNGMVDAETIQLNASERSEPDPNGSGPASYWDASADGSRVFFSSTEALTDDALPGHANLYMYDTSKPATAPDNLSLINIDPAGGLAGNAEGVIGASEDGHRLYFYDSAQRLTPGTPTLRRLLGIYLWSDAGGTPELTYVGEGAGNGLGSSGTVENVTSAELGFATSKARVSPDGEYLMVANAEPGVGITGYNQGHCFDTVGEGCRELYVYSAQTKRLQCVSCNPDGTPAVADSTDNVRRFAGVAMTSSHLNRALTEDGHYAFFSTAEALVSGDTNGAEDVYQMNTRTGVVSLISSGTDPSPSYFMEASPDGHDVYFATRDRLVGWDVDGAYDLYDARAGGGFPEPTPRPAPCSGEDCRPATAATAPPPTAGTGKFAGPGNPMPKRRRKKHQHHKQGKQHRHKHPSGHRGGRR